ncbi:AAA ATPase [Tepidanaerobacter acetatoxydans Re1]|uniref:AAA ATPase n=1 Tax=Tepidanaerobacter acetatoxydans (strain DSM 21804 / JCM 16047 / Re1) TaxID=1209989 RepID=F4LVK4_TEPAE|nr:magnesium chelatase [Tepidanaerobacter acetatoxydans]AEE91590.1 AAA ATPase [Tepidanaerobacter acetatoxydans Re1]CDI40737.1 AAA ATPase [Tepidanaerobacter acetatoxydans Re1]
MKNYSQIIRHSGNASLFDILDVSVTGSLTGTPIHIHAEGLRGTGKTTIIRAYKEVLPKINRIKGCLYNCDPSNPHCPEHYNLTSEEIEKIGVERINMPFLEISPSAKKGSVVGSIDLKKISSKESPEAALLLGTIPKAHRGIVFIDEINRIADTSPEIVDLLLDAMGTKPGRIQIEEAGLPVTEIPVQVSIWAASNPDEDPGPLENIRRQLSDRFDFTVNVERPLDTCVINRIFSDEVLNVVNTATIQKTKEFLEAKKNINRFKPTQEIRDLLASLYVNYGIESLRYVEAALLGTKIRGALLKRNPNIEDVIFITRYALRHRVEMKDLNNILQNLEEKKSLIKKDSISVETSIQNENKLPDSTKVSEINENKNKNSKTFSFDFLKKLLQRFVPNAESAKSSNTSSTAPNPSIKAPPQKALPMDKLKITEYVKTEEDLIK